MYNAAKRLLERMPRIRGAILEVYRWLFALNIIYRVHLIRNIPVLIYQMAKVGSSSIYASFPVEKYGFAVHAHYFFPEQINQYIAFLRRHHQPILRHFYESERVYHQIIAPKLPVKIITPVRDPISRNLSSLFQEFPAKAKTQLPLEHFAVEDLSKLFLENFPHDEPLVWFDEEFKASIGVDIYDYPFPQEKGYLTIHTDWADILLLKIELDDKIIESVIAEFLGLDNFSLNHSNIGESKEYGEIYKAFKNQIILPQEYIDKMLESRFTKHFYSDEERARIREKWMARLAQKSLT